MSTHNTSCGVMQTIADYLDQPTTDNHTSESHHSGDLLSVPQEAARKISLPAYAYESASRARSHHSGDLLLSVPQAETRKISLPTYGHQPASRTSSASPTYRARGKYVACYYYIIH